MDHAYDGKLCPAAFSVARRLPSWVLTSCSSDIFRQATLKQDLLEPFQVLCIGSESQKAEHM